MEVIDISKIHCAYMIGIGGISMSALAMILSEKGIEVRGYDRNDSDTVRQLRERGIQVWLVDDVSAFNGVDLVCYTAAVSHDHPQMILAQKSGAKVISRAELLGSIASSYSNSIAVAGTHGKSTTSGMIGHIFLNAGLYDPTIVVGAVVPEIHSTYRIGSDQNFVFEACEYKDSFLSFYPHIAIVLNIELDHTDYFHSMEQMIASFQTYLSHTGPDGIGILNYDNSNCHKAATGYPGTILWFSAEGNEEADFYAQNICMDTGFARFDVYFHRKFYATVSLAVPGRHNVGNALAAIAAAVSSKVSRTSIVDSLRTYTGVHRRFEPIGELSGAKFYDDYAHHPDEIKATLSAAKQVTKGRVICAFQPHNYSRLHDLFDSFCTSFGDADLLILTKLYAAREKAGTEVSSELLAQRTGATYIDDMEKILPYLESIVQPQDTVLIMGAGDIEKIAEKFKKMKKNA